MSHKLCGAANNSKSPNSREFTAIERFLHNNNQPLLCYYFANLEQTMC